MPYSKRGDEECAAAFDEEEILPAVQLVVFYLEDAEGDEAGEGAGDGDSAVEDGEAEGDFVAFVELG